MIRFILFVILAWLASKVLGIIFQGMARVPRNGNSRKRYGVGTQQPKPPAMEFKNVKDADFVDITEEEHASK